MAQPTDLIYLLHNRFVSLPGRQRSPPCARHAPNERLRGQAFWQRHRALRQGHHFQCRAVCDGVEAGATETVAGATQAGGGGVRAGGREVLCQEYC